MNNAYATYRNNDSKELIEIFLDDTGSTESPLDYDSDWLEFVAVNHQYHLIGNRQVDHEELSELCKDADLVFPVYMYDHSTLAFNLAPFSCPWDSGCIGAMLVNRSAYEKHVGLGADRARETCAAVLAEYESWANGYVFGYQRSKIVACDLGHDHLEEVDSCWGFVGPDWHKSGLLENAGITDPKNQQKLASNWGESE